MSGTLTKMKLRFTANSNKDKTLKKNYFQSNADRDTLKDVSMATLTKGDLRPAVRLPDPDTRKEWLALNCLDFFNQMNLLHGSCLGFCTAESCPTMNAGPKYEYYWADPKNPKKPSKCSATEYVENSCKWLEEQIEIGKLFPTKPEVEFPADFEESIKAIFKWIFRFYAHIYCIHFQKITDLGEDAHFNTCFKLFILFATEFNLLDKKETAPLEKIITLF